MSNLPACPQCTLENTYPDGTMIVCADCGHEWPAAATPDDDEGERLVKDANGKLLQSGDTVVLVRDLKVKGSSVTLKQGSKIKGIRIVDGDHEVDCRTDAGPMLLKACYLKKT